MADQTGAGERARDTRGDHGFTLIESLTAAVALLVIASAIIATLIATSDWYANARMRTEAKAVAEQVMTLILARNYADIHQGEANETWASGAIPKMMDWPSSVGTFSIETSLAPQTDPSTGLPVTQVIVIATPRGRTLNPPVAVIRFASGWQRPIEGNSAQSVDVNVQIRTGQAPVPQAGVRVQLLNVDTMAETYYAVTDGAGIARFKNVASRRSDTSTPVPYFLTSDPRFGTDIRPVHFPERVYPVRVGAGTVVQYTLEVERHSSEAVLSVGAFQNGGEFQNPRDESGRIIWDIVKPYRPAPQRADGTRLTIFAQPELNVPGTESGMIGGGPTYPAKSQLGPYSAQINDYGVAHIEIPWTIDPDIGQRWNIWCTTVNRVTGVKTKWILRPERSTASGAWGTPIDQIDLLDQISALKAPQFIDLSDEDPTDTWKQGDREVLQ